jgi:hypothetical protein
MVFEKKTLDDVLEHIGVLDGKYVQFILWTDTTINCKPIIKVLGIDYPKGMDNTLIKNTIIDINKRIMILSIICGKNQIYRIKDAENFAVKTCESE